MMKSILIITPTYNEVKNIPILIEKIFFVNDGINILFVDDNSPDGSGRLIDEFVERDKRVHVIHREGKLGLGTAYIAGFRYAIEKKYDYIFEMDADFSHDPEEIPNFLNELEHYDLVIGSRYVSGVNVVNWPLRRLILSYVANLYTRIITGMPIKDATGGYKAFRRKVLETLNLDYIRSNGYSFQVEMNYKTYVKNFSIKEIPIIFRDRALGESKMSSSIIKEALFMVWMLRVRKLLGKLK